MSLLHRAVFNDDVVALRTALEQCVPASSHPELNARVRGQTPLSLAVGLNRKECVKILLDAGASTLVKTLDGWSPFQEATSIGDREVMEWIFRRRRSELGGWFQHQGKELLATLSADVKDFYLEMQWQFESWIPFVSQLCPSDTYKVYKQGTSVRIDTTLVGFERMSWIRGDISIIFSETADGPQLVICDHQRKLVQQVYPRDFSISDQDVEEELSVSLNTNIVATPEIDFQSFNISRAQNGFWNFKVDRSESVGPWDTQVWNVESLEFVNRIRTEHLDVEPLPEKVKRERSAALAGNGATKASSGAGSKKPSGGFVVANADESDDAWACEAQDANDADNDEWSQAKRHFGELAAFRGSLLAPPKPEVTAEEFFDESKKDQFLHIGRPKVEQFSTKAWKGTLWMYNEGAASSGDAAKAADEKPATPGLTPSSVLGWIASAASAASSATGVTGGGPVVGPPPIQSSEFPIKLSTLVPLLDLIGMGSNQHVRSLREFFHVQLPPGFPVKIEIPMNLLPLSAVITFQNIKTAYSMTPDLFIIPGKKQGYRAGEVVRGTTEASTF